jgi:hypothetical protein
LLKYFFRLFLKRYETTNQTASDKVVVPRIR